MTAREFHARFLDDLVDDLEDLFRNLEACHEVYCRTKCVAFSKDMGVIRHTTRCEDMKKLYGVSQVPITMEPMPKASP